MIEVRLATPSDAAELKKLIDTFCGIECSTIEKMTETLKPIQGKSSLLPLMVKSWWGSAMVRFKRPCVTRMNTL
jgi:hypothetical protein